MNSEFKLRARRGDIFVGLADKVNLYGYSKEGGKYFVAQKLLMKALPANEISTPFLEIEKHEAQQLMDDLWDCGLRPSEGAGSAGAMKATEKHLEDMKTIAFHVLKISKKE